MVRLLGLLSKRAHSKDRKKKSENDRVDLLSKLSDHDREILEHVEKWVTRWESSVHLLKRRWGLGSAIGLVPGIGDICNVVFAIYILRQCNKFEIGVSKISYAKMVGIVVIYSVIGIFPFLGDLINSLIKFNTLNGAILQKDLRKRIRQQENSLRVQAK